MRKHTPIELQIMREIYLAVEGLGAPMELLSAIGSWGDTLPDEEILWILEDYNDAVKRGEPMTLPLKKL